MSFGPKVDEANMSHQSGNEHDITSTNDQPVEFEDAGSMIAEPDNDNYQDVHPAGIDTATGNVGGDIAHGSLDVEVSSSDGNLGINPILELDETEHEHYDTDAGTAQPKVTQDLANAGTVFSDEAPHINPVLDIK